MPTRPSLPGGSGRWSSPAGGYKHAEAALMDGSALRVFFAMIEAQGGDASVFDNPAEFHKPGATEVVEAWESGFVAEMDTTALGWAVQRSGAGREKTGESVDPHAGIEFHARRGARVELGQPMATIYATKPEMLAEPAAILKQAIHFSESPPRAAVPLVSRVFTRDEAEKYLNASSRSVTE